MVNRSKITPTESSSQGGDRSGRYGRKPRYIRIVDPFKVSREDRLLAEINEIFSDEQAYVYSLWRKREKERAQEAAARVERKKCARRLKTW